MEDHNLQSQFFRQQDIGKLKVDALKEIVLEQSGLEIKTVNAKYDPSHAEGMEVVCTLVDDNDVRKEIVDSLRGVPIVVDSRMA